MTDETQARQDRFARRQAELARMSDDQLKDRFWQLCGQVVEPIAELARTHTSPSIERSVLLRMGVDSISSHGVVDRIFEAGLLQKGAGNVLLRVARSTGKDVRGAAAAILENRDVLKGLFGSVNA